MTTDAKTLAAVIRLQNWLSPVFPVGGFAYSSGLESSANLGVVTNEEELKEWLGDFVANGPLHNDLILLNASWKAIVQEEPLEDIASLARAIASSAERLIETLDQGDAFLRAVSQWQSFSRNALPEKIAFPVAVGALSAKADVPQVLALSSYLQAFINNQLQAAIRLSLIGQTGTSRLMADFERIILTTAQKMSDSTLNDLGSCAFMADIAAMKHETQRVRLFRT